MLENESLAKGRAAWDWINNQTMWAWCSFESPPLCMKRNNKLPIWYHFNVDNSAIIIAQSCLWSIFHDFQRLHFLFAIHATKGNAMTHINSARASPKNTNNKKPGWTDSLTLVVSPKKHKYTSYVNQINMHRIVTHKKSHRFTRKGTFY